MNSKDGDIQYRINREYQKDMMRMAQHHQLAEQTPRDAKRAGQLNTRLSEESLAYDLETARRKLRTKSASFWDAFTRWLLGDDDVDFTRTQEFETLK